MITVCMAVYNGERFLKEQLESLLAQQYTGWRLLAQDDGSADGSFAILQDYAARYPDRISVRRNEPGTGSAAANFFSLLGQVEDDYVMTCDQDDIWLPEKIGSTLAEMQWLEQRFGAQTPLLVHTDLQVVNGALQMLEPSMMRAQALDPAADSLAQLMTKNIVTGCTMMMNRALCKLLRPAPQQALMHDWWAALAAAAFGRIGFLPQATILYRQHGGNAVGAKRVRSLGYLAAKLGSLRRVGENARRTCLQAEEFLQRYGDRLDEPQRVLLGQHAALPYCSRLRRAAAIPAMRRSGIGPARCAVQLLYPRQRSGEKEKKA